MPEGSLRRKTLHGLNLRVIVWVHEGADGASPVVRMRPYGEDGGKWRPVTQEDLHTEERLRDWLAQVEAGWTLPRAWVLARRDERRRQRANHKQQRYFDAKSQLWRDLHRLHVGLVLVEFSGSGDEGGIDGITATAGNGENVPLPKDLKERISDAFYMNFPYGFEGEGCHGTLTLDVTNRTATLEVGLPSIEWTTRSLGREAATERDA